ncbi:MAG: glycosyltransferase [Clostridium sp.]|nr:glycosyltransferase [Clostridium sp.]
MKDQNSEILALLERCHGDTKRILTENKKLPYLYALAVLRENLLEWIPMEKDWDVLQEGADYGALTGLLSGRCRSVTVRDASEKSLEVILKRWETRDNIRTVLPEELSPEARFDCVTLIGTFPAGRPLEDQVREAQGRLKPGGRLILAVQNRYGAKYLAGAPEEPVTASREELEKLLPGAAFYYPMPDYRTASVIYSDGFLPQKGELAGMPALYDTPKYQMTDIGGVLERAASDGKFPDFANSFLAVCPAPAGPEMLYAKYNRTRREQFQIKTEIILENGIKKVRKSALCPEGREHISSFAEKYRLLTEQNPDLSALQPVLSEDGTKASFRFLSGKTLSETIAEKTLACPEEKRTEAFLDGVREAMGRICAVLPAHVGKFVPTAEFREVFGASGELSGEDLELLSDEAWDASNIDALLENFIVTPEGPCALDYEWVFTFPVPAGFVRGRILMYAFRRLGHLAGEMTEEEFLGQFPEYVTADRDVLAVYEKMERGFQEYVHGENQRTYQEDYMVKTRTGKDLASVDGELQRTKERLSQVQELLRRKDLELRKERETHRLTNNHVSNLNVMISDLRRENGEMAKTLAYLNRHEAAVFKVRRKMGEAFNRAYPKGTAKRKKLTYAKNTLLHPAKYMAMYRSEEGKNLIRGDFEIGDDYRTYGKLHFPKEEHPEVSIVIPCYNQIHYTYLCLVSILEHTKDVSYEVIIADDVSSDATEHLAEFAENLVICRNSTNQGFLKNCNQAAKAARGTYIMFLNNDTKVTEGWLSSLTGLMEKDQTVGMCGSKLVYPDGRLQEAGGIIWSDGSGWNYGRLDDPDKAEYNYVKDVDYISGAAILIRRSLWEEIGGFDERYAPAYCEDSDLAFEVRRHGYRVVYQPLSKVIHFEGISNGTDVAGTGLKRYQVENSEKLREKWSEEFRKQCDNTGNPNPFRARERSMGKKILLVVDHYVPTWDRDAGSKTTFQYLKMFLKEGYQVKFLGDNLLHEEPYTTTLQQMGIEVIYGAEYETGIWDWIDKNWREISAVYLNRPHIATKYVDYIKEHTGLRMIFYGHDLHFLRLFREYELSGDVKARQESEYWKSVEFTLMHKVDMSYYPSQVEIDAIHAEDDTIPAKAITAYVYDTFLDNINENFAEREGLLFVGGFAHPPNADAVLWFVREVFPAIRRELPVNFYIVGSRATEEIKALHNPSEGIIVKGFVSDEELAALYQSCRLVVVPLRYGAGVKGKVVEAIYNGAPIITTSVGSEGIENVENVLEVEDIPENFAKKTVELCRDPEKLLAMSRATQDYIRSRFSTEAAWEVIKTDFE